MSSADHDTKPGWLREEAVKAARESISVCDEKHDLETAPCMDCMADAIEATAKAFAERALRAQFTVETNNWTGDPEDEASQCYFVGEELKALAGCGCCGKRDEFGTDAGKTMASRVASIVAAAIEAAEK